MSGSHAGATNKNFELPDHSRREQCRAGPEQRSRAGGTTDGGRVHASNAFIWRYRSLWKTPCGSWAGLRPCEPDEVGRAWGRKLGHTWAASNTQKWGIRFRYPG